MAITPILTKIAAVAVMGKPGFNFVKQCVSKLLGRMWLDRVSRARYRFGLVLFIGAIIFDLLFPYFPGYYVDWKSNGIFWSLVGDVGMIAGVFTLGGEFWNKIMALFRYDANIAVSADGAPPVRPH